jgi:microcystin degradation protein MlrC
VERNRRRPRLRLHLKVATKAKRKMTASWRLASAKAVQRHGLRGLTAEIVAETAEDGVIMVAAVMDVDPAAAVVEVAAVVVAVADAAAAAAIAATGNVE